MTALGYLFFLTLTLTLTLITWILFSVSLTEPRVEDGREDAEFALALHLQEGDVVEVSHEAGGHRVTTTTRWTHGATEPDVHKLSEGTW